MPLKDLYIAEFGKRMAALQAEAAPQKAANAQLARLHDDLVANREEMRLTSAEIELLDDELQIDPGPVLIRVLAAPDGQLRVTYEVKRPTGAVQATVPGVETYEDVESAIVRLLVQYNPTY